MLFLGVRQGQGQLPTVSAPIPFKQLTHVRTNGGNANNFALRSPRFCDIRTSLTKDTLRPLITVLLLHIAYPGASGAGAPFKGQSYQAQGQHQGEVNASY